jgi:hypothetical protein
LPFESMRARFASAIRLSRRRSPDGRAMPADLEVVALAMSRSVPVDSVGANYGAFAVLSGIRPDGIGADWMLLG